MTQNRSRDRSLAIFCLCLVGILLFLFWDSLKLGKVLFSNDGPLGAMNQKAIQLPAGFKGIWYDLNTIGASGGTANPDISEGLLWLLHPAGYANYLVPIILLMLGLSAWSFFSTLQFSRWACALGGLAAALNSGFFSAACWGVGQQIICFACNFLALAALGIKAPRWSWLKYVLAGLALGMGVMEGADIGAIFSVVFAGFVFWSALVAEGPPAGRILRGVGCVVIVAVFAVLIAAQGLNVLIGTSIKGVAGTEQDAETKARHWDFSTQWSLPKRETLSLLIPGLFGFRMDTPQGLSEGLQELYRGGQYWGAIGRDPAWDRYFAAGEQGPAPDPRGQYIRYSGGGVYPGLPVVLIALWAAVQAMRKKGSVFTLAERKSLWFWIATVIVALLIAFGRFAPFYRWLYALPYVSTTRNPAKFIHVVNFAIVILFAYGVDGLIRKYITAAPNLKNRVNSWWATAGAFDKRCVVGSVIAVVASLLGWMIYSSARGSLEHYLQTVQFDEGMARAIAGFSIGQVGWFVLFLVLTVALMIGILSGRFAGARAKLGLTLLGLLLVLDLARANLPWILYWDFKEKYATNPVIDFLRDKPFEHRVAIFPMERFIRLDRLPPEARPLIETYSQLYQIYRIEWTQHHFLYYNIQSLDIIQMPRTPEDLLAYEHAVQPNPLRWWELTNTRYLLAPSGLLEFFNQQLDPVQHRFRIVTQFNLNPKSQFAIFEFTGALPRVKLYSSWQVNTNDQAVLTQLAAKDFDPAQTVLVDTAISASSAATNQAAGTVEFVSYTPERIALRAKSSSPSVLLLNDKFDPDWKVSVDGKPAALLRCNFIMRGVQVPPGNHLVEFRWAPSVKGLYVSLAGMVLGLGLVGFLAFSTCRKTE